MIGKRAKGSQKMKMIDWVKARLSVRKNVELDNIASDREKDGGRKGREEDYFIDSEYSIVQ